MAEEARKIVRSRRKSFRDVYIAKIKENSVTEYSADTPVKLARAISGKIADKFTVEKIYSDDGVEDTATTYEGTDIELEVNSLAPQDKALLFGQLFENGFLTTNQDDQAPEVALGYRSKRMNGKYEFTWHYVGKFGEGLSEDYQTEADKLQTQTNSIKGSFYDRAKDGNIRLQVDESNLIDADTDAKQAITNWFSKVQETAPAGNT